MVHFLKIENTKQTLDRPFIVRLDSSLYDRLNCAVATVPALSGISKSEFVRRAMWYALEAVETEVGTKK